MNEQKHIIWSSDVDYEDWRADLEEQYPDLSEQERMELINERLENARSQLAHATEQLENARTEMTAPFPREAELAEKTRRLNELNVLLNLNEPDRVVMSEEPDEGGSPRPRTADRER